MSFVFPQSSGISISNDSLFFSIIPWISNWTASFHYRDEDDFIENCKIISKDVSLSISIVIQKKKFTQSLAIADKLFRMGFRINLIREVNKDVEWKDSAELKILEEYRMKNFNVMRGKPLKYNFESGFLCKAGYDYFTIMPDGKIYRCFSEAMTGDPIGDVYNVKPSTEYYHCYRDCFGYSLDHIARIKKI